jgi:hypothetical protein
MMRGISMNNRERRKDPDFNLGYLAAIEDCIDIINSANIDDDAQERSQRAIINKIIELCNLNKVHEARED